MDFNTAILKNEEKITFALRSLYAGFGYGQYKMSKFEEYELYVNNKDFLISPDIITFTDTNGRLMALKPDVTLSIVRASRPAPGETLKVYYDENVYRISKSSRSFREIRQVGLECIGAVDDYCIGEVLTLAAESLRLISGENRLNLSHLGIVGGMLDRLGLQGETRKHAVRCIGEKNLHELESVCLSCGADRQESERLKRLMLCGGAAETVLPALRELGCDEAAVSQLERLAAMLEDSGAADQIRIDFSVLGDMNYYNGIAFQGYVPGVPASVISGGQYDKLLARMGRKGGAIGFACCLDQLERLSAGERRTDVDVVLLYDVGADPLRVAAAVRQLQSGGRRVSALKTLPEKLSYRQALRLTESGVTPLA